MEKITLYTTHCPKCRILESKLKQKNIEFEICEDVDKMREMGVLSVPVLQVDGNKMSYYDAVQFINQK